MFLTRVDELAPIVAERALAATFALRAGMPDGAVFVARRMGRDGIALPDAGLAGAVRSARAARSGILTGHHAAGEQLRRWRRQFLRGARTDAVDAADGGECGKTAWHPGVGAGVDVGRRAHNIRLGTAYLQEVLTRFDGNVPLAAAAYNAGPHRVAQWLGDNGDPRTGPIGMVDWIELIPVAETRNYVQRVTENVVMYRARKRRHDADTGGHAMDPLIRPDQRPGTVYRCMSAIWRGGDSLPPILCLPGLVRTGGDFEVLAPLIGGGPPDGRGRLSRAGRFGPHPRRRSATRRRPARATSRMSAPRCICIGRSLSAPASAACWRWASPPCGRPGARGGAERHRPGHRRGGRGFRARLRRRRPGAGKPGGLRRIPAQLPAAAFACTRMLRGGEWRN